jgi:hypothetical protein
MIGLKTFLKEFSGFTGGELSHDALYARQRELVRCGLLPSREGRGPGSGVPLSPDTLATFLIGLLATDSLTDLGEHTAQLCKARPLEVSKGRSSSRIGRPTFRADVARVLIGSKITGFQPGDDINQNLYSGIQVTRHWRGVLLQNREIQTPDGNKREGMQGVEYLVGEDQRLASSMLSRTVSIEQELFWMLCLRLRHYMGLP